VKRSAIIMIICGLCALCFLAGRAVADPVAQSQVTVIAPADAGVVLDAPGAAVPAPTQPAVIDPPAAPDVSAVQQLWRSGAFLGAGIVALYLLLTLAGSLDPRRALLWTGGAAALGTTVDTIMGTGTSPNLSMLITAGVAFAGIVAKYRSLIAVGPADEGKA
jgi:hypothetical protein